MYFPCLEKTVEDRNHRDRRLVNIERFCNMIPQILVRFGFGLPLDSFSHNDKPQMFKPIIVSCSHKIKTRQIKIV